MPTLSWANGVKVVRYLPVQYYCTCTVLYSLNHQSSQLNTVDRSSVSAITFHPHAVFCASSLRHRWPLSTRDELQRLGVVIPQVDDGCGLTWLPKQRQCLQETVFVCFSHDIGRASRKEGWQISQKGLSGFCLYAVHALRYGTS